MPRNPNNPDEFVAGQLPKIMCNNKQYYVDGRMQQIRNVDDYSDIISSDDLEILAMSDKDYSVALFEFYGE